MEKRIIIGLVILILLVVGFFIIFLTKSDLNILGEDSNVINAKEKLWWNAELKDIRTGKNFRISDFEGKPILVESFAVWCPTCTKQQRETKKFEAEIGDAVISISLDTDPNEDESRIKKHIDENGFDWYYAISPIEVTKSLIEDFGVEIVNAPFVPVILICEDGSARKLNRGVKNVESLKTAIASCN